MKTINDFNFENKTAIIRVDFNVPLNEAFEVTDTTRIEAAKPTILKVLEDGGRAVLMSHLGRPKGVEDQFSLNHITDVVSNVLGITVKFVHNCIGDDAEKAAAELQNGEILLLENLRFHPEEKAGDKEFAEKLSRLGDIYVNDAFGTAHRAHASTTVIAQFFPESKCFGILLAKEIESLNIVLNNSVRPVTAIIGGAKVSSKID
ncbi:MAG: phosphoglycerate kinase, partial [Flavobacteriaceae bacterium]|nr:phosphoglycerate kinase [Flavobacteriaceae bacterium]